MRYKNLSHDNHKLLELFFANNLFKVLLMLFSSFQSKDKILKTVNNYMYIFLGLEI